MKQQHACQVDVPVGGTVIPADISVMPSIEMRLWKVPSAAYWLFSAAATNSVVFPSIT